MTVVDTSLTLRARHETATGVSTLSIISTASHWAGYLLLFLILFLPTSYQLPKAILLAAVVAIILLRMVLTGRTYLSREVALLTFGYVILGILLVARGIAFQTPGALRVSTVFVFWPLVYLVLMSGISSRKVLYNVLKVLVLATIAIELYAFSFILYSAGILPEFLYIPLEQGQEFVSYDGIVAIRLYSISALLFTLPFIVTALFLPQRRGMTIIRPLWLWVAAVLGIAVVILRASNGMLLILGLTPAIAVILWWMVIPAARLRLPVKLIWVAVVAAIGVVFVALLYPNDTVRLMEAFTEGFNFSSGVEATIRKDQFYALINEWTHYPLFGAGLGASAASYIRTPEMPWAYELTYVALLFQTGVVGVALFSFGIMWIYWAGGKIARLNSEWAGFLLPTLVGMTTFLIANATNPYLIKFDYLWVIFLPIAIINLWICEKRVEKRKENVLPVKDVSPTLSLNENRVMERQL